MTNWLALILVGWATYTNPGVLDEVYGNRLGWGQVEPCPGCLGKVALLECGDIGRKVWIGHDGDWLGPYLVVDCAHARHRQGLSDRSWVVDLPPELAERWQMAGPIWVTVRDRPSAVHPGVDVR